MRDSNTRHFTASATLAAIGLKLNSLDLLDPIAQHVVINQKTVSHSPIDKLTDILIAVLAGAKSMVEINTLLRSDLVLQRAFGRESCAEQSVIQRTLNACTPDNVKQMGYACEIIFHNHSRSSRHRYSKELLLLDIDFTGILCGASCELASKGYFSNQRTSQVGHARGRQIGRVIAAQYEEIVCDLLFAGNQQLRDQYQNLVKTAEQTLVLTEEKRARTLIRMDAGAGSLDAINWLLERSYRVLVKDCSNSRASAFSKVVNRWYSDPRHPGREVGEAIISIEEYISPVRRILVRGKRHKTGQWAYGMNISNLLPHEARNIARVTPEEMKVEGAELLAYAWAYDARGGTIEIEIKEDKQGLGISKRQKKRATAQQMLVLINLLAHNILVWVRGWIHHHAPELARFGLLRWVRDLLRISGVVIFNKKVITQLLLNKASPFARPIMPALAALLIAEQASITLGQL